MSEIKYKGRISQEESKTGFYNSQGSEMTRIGDIKTPACRLWENIKIRCKYLPERFETRFGNYSGASVCEEWKDFQNFSLWYKGYQYKEEGWQLDKDLLVKGNKIYSPETCVFLPQEINNILNTRPRQRGDLPIGMSKAKPPRTGILLRFQCKDERFNIVQYIKPTEIEEGFKLYKNAREGYVKSLALKYKERLDPRAYQALITYEIDIGD